MTESFDYRSVYMKATEAHLRNEFGLAIELYRKLIFLDPMDPMPRHYLGLLLLQNGYLDVGRRMIFDACALARTASEKAILDHNLKAIRGDPSTKISNDLEFDEQSARYQPFIANTVGDWRHRRMLEFASVFAASDYTWLTIGDHYGHDARRLRLHGIENITISSLSTVALEQALTLGEITSFLKIDAECIELPNEAFDFVVCKEALHHMSRPYLAIYEMLRVARRGVFLLNLQIR